MKNFILTACAVFAFITFANAQIIPSYIPTSGLVGWWPFNGNANDESGNTINGNVIGALLTSDRNSQINKAYDFDFFGAAFGLQNDEVYLPYNSQLNVSNITVSVWIYPRSYFWTGNSGDPRSVILNRFQYTLSLPSGGAWMISMNQTSVSGLVMNSTGTSGIAATTLAPISLNAWHHIVMTYDLSNIKVFVDGVLSATQPNTIPMNISGNSGISIGESRQANGYWNYTDGKIDDIGIWNRALTACEIKKLYNLNSGVSLSTSSNTICLGESVVLNATGSTNYLWSNGATSPSITVTPTVTSIYSVTTTYSLGCTETQTLSVTVNPCTGIDELDNNQSIIFYPNPFNNEIYVKTEGDIKNKKYFIYNASGQVIESGILNSNKIKCSDFSKGLYFIKLEGTAKTFKLVKEN